MCVSVYSPQRKNVKTIVEYPTYEYAATQRNVLPKLFRLPEPKHFFVILDPISDRTGTNRSLRNNSSNVRIFSGSGKNGYFLLSLYFLSTLVLAFN